MNDKQYREICRTNKGKLTSMDTQLNNIFYKGSDTFIYFIASNKYIGIQSASDIVDSISREDQTDLVKWISLNSPNRSAIQLQVESYETV